MGKLRQDEGWQLDGGPALGTQEILTLGQSEGLPGSSEPCSSCGRLPPTPFLRSGLSMLPHAFARALGHITPCRPSLLLIPVLRTQGYSPIYLGPDERPTHASKSWKSPLSSLGLSFYICKSEATSGSSLRLRINGLRLWPPAWPFSIPDGEMCLLPLYPLPRSLQGHVMPFTRADLSSP